MGPTVQAAGVTGVPAVGLRRGESGQPRTANPRRPQKKAGGQGKCSHTTKGGSREPPS